MRENPYNRIKREATDWILAVRNPQKITMFLYPSKRLAEGWSLEIVAQRTQAASQLGYDVQLRVTDDGLLMEYVKRQPSPPWWY
jgi:hypothetical protein